MVFGKKVFFPRNESDLYFRYYYGGANYRIILPDEESADFDDDFRLEVLIDPDEPGRYYEKKLLGGNAGRLVLCIIAGAVLAVFLCFIR